MDTLININYTEPILYLAIHNGHILRNPLKKTIGLSPLQRKVEEDPFTELFLSDKKNKIIQSASRFEYDLNRKKDFAVYQKPEDCWGLPIYQDYTLSSKDISFSKEKYDYFYHQISDIIEKFIEIHKKVFIWDVHSYNHHRKGNDAEFDSIEDNPDIILGTNHYKYMPDKWKPLISNIQNHLSSFSFKHKYINRADTDLSFDVRQNVKFPGGNLSQYINSKYGEDVCCTAIEFKKIWMNEWTQEIDLECYSELKKAFDSCDKIITSFLYKL
ncbi:MAG: N-formylglutamate amidohydrolase [Candidatus Cloacimonetes bacterium]|jgi:hypothetical protein|nr:N-formylglutamate amidohydrolase [Candidatus Cloacimonadota bacterium]MDD4156554.1 N-formylglutamate amidohydrolase [Candidatus Cloacimonadota bacterium]